MIEEDDNGILEANDIELKLNSNITTYSISAINDDTSTYMGVKSINEDISSINCSSKNQKTKNNQKKKKKSFSSITESSNSESSSIKKNPINNENNNKDNDNNNIKENNEVKTLFEWEGGGENVFITGSFCEWKEFYKMNKNGEGMFSLTLSLPRGFHQYKFKVDDNWEYSKSHPKFEDNGNVNNYIDTTSQNENWHQDNSIEKSTNEKSEEKEKSKEGVKKKDKSKQGKKKKKKTKKRYSSIHTVNFLNSQVNYTTYFPLKSELNIKPSSLPGLYKTHFILNEDFKPQKLRRFTKVEYVNDSSSEESSESSSSSFSDSNSDPSIHSKISIFGELIPYVKFQNLYHIHSNHLHSKMMKYKDNTISSLTSRYRLKFSTFIYYKPINQVEKQKRRVKHSKTVNMKKKKN
jgi:hypothetical protein